MPSKSDTLPRAWLVVGVLFVVAALNYLDRLMVASMRKSLNEVIPMTETQFGWLTAIFLMFYGVLSPFGGLLADCFNRTRIIIVSLLVWSLLTWLTGQVKTYEQMFWVRGLMGISEAAYIPAALALIADYHRGSTRSLAVGFHMMGISIGSMLGGFCGKVAQWYGAPFTFSFFGWFGILYCVVLMLTLREAPRESQEIETPAGTSRASLGEALVALLGTGSFWLLVVFWSLLGLAGWALTGWLPVYFMEKFHLEQGDASIYAYWPLYIAAIFGKPIAGIWADRWSSTNERARILVPFIGLCIAAPAIGLIGGTSVLFLAIAGLVVYGFTRTFSDTNLMPILCQVADSRCRATGYGVLNMFATLVGGLTILAGGMMRDAKVDVSLLFLGAAAGLFVCAGLLFMVKPKSRDTLGKA